MSDTNKGTFSNHQKMHGSPKKDAGIIYGVPISLQHGPTLDLPSGQTTSHASDLKIEDKFSKQEWLKRISQSSQLDKSFQQDESKKIQDLKKDISMVKLVFLVYFMNWLVLGLVKPMMRICELVSELIRSVKLLFFYDLC